MRPLAIVFATFMAVAIPSQSSLAQTPAPPLVRTEGLRQISTHVHIIPDGSVGGVPNVGFVVGDKAVLVIDTGLGARNGRAVAEVAQRLAGARAIYLVTTHVHPEHDLGADAFPATTKMIRSADQETDIAETGMQVADIFRKMSPLHAELLAGAAFRKADIRFQNTYDLDLGGLVVNLIAEGANHTLGDTAIWVGGDRVLFSGDTAMKGGPFLTGTHPTIAHFLATLDRLEALKPAIIVPSHGPTGGVEFIAGYRAYLTDVLKRTAAEKRAGKTVDQAVETVSAAIGPHYPGVTRGLADTVRIAYREAR